MSGEAISSCLYFGRVMHKRLQPFTHRFVYRSFAMFIDIDELPHLDRKLRFFSHNRANLFAFFDKDHGARDGSAPRDWVEQRLGEQGISIDGGRVQVLCMPRMLGYVFNPLSIWFCRDRDGRLKAIVYEVRNTFGEHHAYVEPVAPDWQEGEALLQNSDKAFYVSPFIGMKARYDFRLKPPGDSLSVVIRQRIPEGELLIATQNGRRAKLTSLSLVSTLVRYPLMTFKVMGAIHWEALRLWLKGARLQPRPPKRVGSETAKQTIAVKSKASAAQDSMNRRLPVPMAGE